MSEPPVVHGSRPAGRGVPTKGLPQFLAQITKFMILASKHLVSYDLIVIYHRFEMPDVFGGLTRSSFKSKPPKL